MASVGCPLSVKRIGTSPNVVCVVRKTTCRGDAASSSAGHASDVDALAAQRAVEAAPDRDGPANLEIGWQCDASLSRAARKGRLRIDWHWHLRDHATIGAPQRENRAADTQCGRHGPFVLLRGHLRPLTLELHHETGQRSQIRLLLLRGLACGLRQHDAGDRVARRRIGGDVHLNLALRCGERRRGDPTADLDVAAVGLGTHTIGGGNEQRERDTGGGS